LFSSASVIGLTRKGSKKWFHKLEEDLKKKIFQRRTEQEEASRVLEKKKKKKGKVATITQLWMQ